jgi:hypothetical protein
MIERLPFIVLSSGIVLFAGILVSEITAEPAPEADIAAATPPHSYGSLHAVRPEPIAGVDQMIATILARPLFSAGRRPPDAGNAVVDTSFDNTRLAGILTESGQRFALFAPLGAKPMVVKEGDTVNGWRIDNITPSEVALSGPGGSKTLQPKNDPNLIPPPAPPPPGAAAAPPQPPGRPPLPGAERRPFSLPYNQAAKAPVLPREPR